MCIVPNRRRTRFLGDNGFVQAGRSGVNTFMSTQSKKKRAPQFSLTNFIIVILVTIALFLIVDFGCRAATNYRINNESQRLRDGVADLRARHEMLRKRLEYVQGDAYVEEIARTQLKWTRPGETVVVVVTPAGTPPDPVSGVAPLPDRLSAPQSDWLPWWFLFFDTVPPTDVF
jgi:cell division protein FtsB